MRKTTAWWMGRAAWAIATGTGLFLSAGACGDDIQSTTDAGPVLPPPSIPPYFPPAPFLEGVDTTGSLGTPVLVADIGVPTDGPSWRETDHALYFTAPTTTPSLRRWIADGGVETVSEYDGGPPGPYGTANGGGSILFATEVNALTTIDFDADGGPTTARRSGAFERLGDIAVELRPDASALAFFVDTALPRAYRYEPGAANELVRILDVDTSELAGTGLERPGLRATGIAVGRDDVERRVVYVALGDGATGYVALVTEGNRGEPVVKDRIQLPGLHPNAIAVDERGYVFVAWARGINVYRVDSSPMGGSLVGASPGLAIGAAPTSLTFGGPDRQTLYVTTAAGKVYAVPAKEPGILR